MRVGLFKEMLEVSPRGVERDAEVLRRFADSFTLDQLGGDAGLGGREPVEISQDVSVGLWTPVRIGQEDGDRGMIPAQARATARSAAGRGRRRRAAAKDARSASTCPAGFRIRRPHRPPP